MPFPKVWTQSETQAALSCIWTRITNSISDNENHYTKWFTLYGFKNSYQIQIIFKHIYLTHSKTLTSTTIMNQSCPESNGNDRLLHIPQKTNGKLTESVLDAYGIIFTKINISVHLPFSLGIFWRHLKFWRKLTFHIHCSFMSWFGCFWWHINLWGLFNANILFNL